MDVNDGRSLVCLAFLLSNRGGAIPDESENNRGNFFRSTFANGVAREYRVFILIKRIWVFDRILFD